MTPIKATIACEIQDQLDIQSKQSFDIVETLLEIMKRTLEKGEKLTEFCSDLFVKKQRS